MTTLSVCVYTVDKMNKTTRFNILLEPKLYDWLEEEAEKRRMSMSALIRQLMWKEKEGGDKK